MGEFVILYLISIERNNEVWKSGQFSILPDSFLTVFIFGSLMGVRLAIGLHSQLKVKLVL